MKSQPGKAPARPARNRFNSKGHAAPPKRAPAEGLLADPAVVDLAIEHLRSADPAMLRLIDQVGPFQLKLRRRRFETLVRSIIWQQISTTAARSIWRRFQNLAGAVTPETIVRLSPEALRSAGLSPQKSKYLLDLSLKVLDGRVPLHRLSRMPDPAVIEALVQVNGIGVWTAQMFLIFSLGRLDVFPSADLGIRVALRKLYGLAELPDTKTAEGLAAPWRPYASVASWYCWRMCDGISLKSRPQDEKPRLRN